MRRGGIGGWSVGGTVAVAIGLYGLVGVLNVQIPDSGHAVELLFVLPIALVALRFGRRSGTAAALAGVLLLAVTELLAGPHLGAEGYATRSVAFLTLGVMLGHFADVLRRHAEQGLSRERSFLAAILESLDTGIMACDANGALRLCNQASRDFYGLPQRSLPPWQWTEHWGRYHGDGKTPMRADELPLRRTLAGERIRNVPMVIRSKSGSSRSLLASGQPIVDAGGSLQGAVVALHDVTAQVRAEAQLTEAVEATLTRLARAVEYRDAQTGDHIGRMSRYAELLAEAAGLDGERCARIGLAGRMHDVGKLAVPDSVLLKPGELTSEERKIMERHTLTGFALLAGTGNEVLDLAAVIALSHHERVDGAGYPHGLADDSIPLEARIVALADVFDALISDRVYRPRFPVEHALSTMSEGRGSQFDADLLDVFLSLAPRLVAAGRAGPVPSRRMACAPAA